MVYNEECGADMRSGKRAHVASCVSTGPGPQVSTGVPERSRRSSPLCLHPKGTLSQHFWVAQSKSRQKRDKGDRREGESNTIPKRKERD